MRILFIAPLPPPVTGQSLAAKVLFDELCKFHQVEVVNFSKDSFVQGVTSFARIFQVARILKEIWRKKTNADVIYLTISESFAGNIKDIITYLICFKSLHKVVVHLHGGSIRKLLFDKHRLFFVINRYFLRRLAGIIVLGQSHVESFSDIVPASKIHVVPNFAEDNLFVANAGITDKFKMASPLRLLFLSNFIEGKGYYCLLDAYFKLSPEYRRKVVIDFAGSFESESDKTSFLSKIHGEDNLHCHGTVAGQEKEHLLKQAHVLCFPSSLLEGQPIVILEAYAAGCAVMATGQAGMRDIFRAGVNGYEIEPESADSVKSVIIDLLAKPHRLLQLALQNREEAGRKYMAKTHRSSLGEIIRSVGELNYKVCSNCIMDTTDSNITFDERGCCDYCRNYRENIQPHWHPDERGAREIAPVIEQIKRDGKGRGHDCLIGISGGVDSSYVAYLAKEKFGLRPLLFHVDAGWNSQVSTNNIEKLVDGLGLDLHTEVVNWEEMKDLQLAFFKAQVPHVDTPQDHAFFASLYNFAAEHNFKYILTGANYSTECVREPLEWHYHASDLRQLKDIHNRFGQRPLVKFPQADIFKYKLYYRYVKGIQVVKPLNHVPFLKEQAMQLLVDRFGWQKYAHKHYESRFTRFYEGYWLPKKFGYDKRRAHYSSLILTGQLSREEALKRIATPAYDELEMKQDFEFVATKLDLTVPELQAIMDGPNKTYRDYKSSMPLIGLGTQVLRLLGVQKAIIR